MGGWSNAARQDGWVRRTRHEGRSLGRTGWTPSDIALLAGTFFLHWELGLAFLALKLWHQASGFQGSVLSFARVKWDALVGLTSSLMGQGSLPFSGRVGSTSSGNLAFDAWRRGELQRIDAERSKLQAAEQEFMTYRSDLLQARDREAFDRFMQHRSTN